MKIRISNGFRKAVRKQPRKINREALFQREVGSVFRRMSAEHKPQGAFYIGIFQVRHDITAVYPELDTLIKELGLDVQRDSFKRKAIFEHLKNASAHGGEALVVARRYKDYKKGEPREILEVIIWDNGPGIDNLKLMVQEGESSRPNYFGSMSGVGKGLDYIVGYEDAECTIPRYVADEIIIETRDQKAERKHNIDPHNFSQLTRRIPGTKITVRFWL